MTNLIINTRSESSDNKYLVDNTLSSIDIQDTEENHEIDEIDFDDVDYYTAEGNYYYYLEVEEG